MKEIWEKYKERFVVKGYQETGYMLGECISYLVYDVDPRWWLFPFSWFEKNYYDLGYALIEEDEWTLSGGYGKNIENLFRVKRTDETLLPGEIQSSEVEYVQSETEPNTSYYKVIRKRG